MEESGETHAMPWGSFPAEEYLVRNWNYDSDETHAEQCQRLVRMFLQQGKILVEKTVEHNGTDFYKPTKDEIDLILRPWRSERLRQIAGALKLFRDDEVVILRTHYSGRSIDEENMLKIVEEDEDYDPNGDPSQRWWRILDSSSYSNSSVAWDSVFDTLPELTARGIGRESYLDMEHIRHEADEEEDDDNVIRSFQVWACLRGLHIAIVDEIALGESRLKFLFLDANGNIVRHTRIVTEEIHIYRMSAFRGSLWDSAMWQDAEIGEMYKPDGVFGSMLTQTLREVRLEAVGRDNTD